MPKAKRRIKLIQPRLQLKLVFTFLGLAAFGVLFECILFAACLAELAADLPQEGPLLLESTPAMLRKVALISAAGILPLVFLVGVLVTFRIAGPLHRLEVFLKQIARGEQPADCTLRQGDELKDFCKLINEATAPLRRPMQSEPLRRPMQREPLRRAADEADGSATADEVPRDEAA